MEYSHWGELGNRPWLWPGQQGGGKKKKNQTVVNNSGWMAQTDFKQHLPTARPLYPVVHRSAKQEHQDWTYVQLFPSYWTGGNSWGNYWTWSVDLRWPVNHSCIEGGRSDTEVWLKDGTLLPQNHGAANPQASARHSRELTQTSRSETLMLGSRTSNPRLQVEKKNNNNNTEQQQKRQTKQPYLFKEVSKVSFDHTFLSTAC